MKILFTFLLLTISISSFAQDSISYKSYRSVWSIIPHFGVGDKQTRSSFTTYGGIGLRREFSLFKLLSLNAIVSYSSAYGKYGQPNLNTLSAGGGLTVYPIYFYDLIFGKTFLKMRGDEKSKADVYFDISVEYNLNNTKYGSSSSVPNLRAEYNFGRGNLNKILFLSPKFGFQFLSLEQPIGSNNHKHYSFYYIGAAIGLNPKLKNR
ncbi:hypothetical protein [Mucilaginibacter arboris]|uniref:Outer membrane protein beta-barrel domain-containing protein n=1 Tax=Mucilaginibacter arboris TaxID=2682090 RepID=A0A7K1SUY3_9SPHI|nr:hypothetical protein [Mucilaginibacter arboris]MVN20850.1 hypothetical protein [Mucilaginibacter arboris]